MKNLVILVVFTMLVAGNVFAQQQKGVAPVKVVPYSNVTKTPAAAPAKAPTAASKAPAAITNVAPASKTPVNNMPAASAGAPKEAAPTGGSVISAAPVAPVSAPVVSSCWDLPTTFSGGDLRFNQVIFYEPVDSTGGVSDIMVQVVFSNGSTTPIPEDLGVRIRVTPNNTPSLSYMICTKSITLDTPSDAPWPALATANSVFVGMPHVAVGAGGGYTTDNSLTIDLDPDNYIVEENELNNMVHCTAFDVVAYRTPSPHLDFIRILDANRSYEGTCTIVDIP